MPLVEARSRIALKNILFPTDFSERSAAALPYAAAIARRFGSKVYLLHVLAPDSVIAAGENGSPASPWQIPEQEMAILDRSDLLNDIRYETLLESGELWDVLSDAIRSREIDLIVLGTHGRGGFKKLLLGSVAEEIVREAPCPVLTIGPEIMAPPARNLRQVLFATDFRPGSLAALMHAVFFAEENRARLTVLHVVELPHGQLFTDDLRQHSLRRLREMLPQENYLLWEPKLVAETGPAAEVVLQQAKKESADLLVMGAREVRHHWTAAHFAWTTLHQILCEARCPVLTVRG